MNKRNWKTYRYVFLQGITIPTIDCQLSRLASQFSHSRKLQIWCCSRIFFNWQSREFRCKQELIIAISHMDVLKINHFFLRLRWFCSWCHVSGLCWYLEKLTQIKLLNSTKSFYKFRKIDFIIDRLATETRLFHTCDVYSNFELA